MVAHLQALKNLLAVAKHFAEFQEDQFDFHSYCIRKMTLRAYLDLLRMEDSLYAASSFLKAVWATIEVYVHLADNPSNTDQVILVANFHSTCAHSRANKNGAVGFWELVVVGEGCLAARPIPLC